jgi:hypothetical protein
MLRGTGSQQARRGSALALLITLAFSATLLGCGGASDNGVASKSADEILAASKDAVASATSVRVKGRQGEGPRAPTITLALGSTGGMARLSFRTGTLEIIRIGGSLYLKGPPGVYRALRATSSQGHWLRLAANNPQAAQLLPFTELTTEVDRLLEPGGAIIKGSKKTVNGQKAIALVHQGAISVRTIYIATTGKPYPIAVAQTGQIVGEDVFSDWNKPVSLSAPAGAVDLTGPRPGG